MNFKKSQAFTQFHFQMHMQILIVIIIHFSKFIHFNTFDDNDDKNKN